MLYINVTSIDPFFPPSHDQYRAPEYPDVQIKPRRGTADGVNKACSRLLTLKPSLTFCPRALYWTHSHARRWVGGGGGGEEGFARLTCEAPAQVDMCLCPCRQQRGEQQSGRVAMRPSGNWMSRSAFLAEPV